MKKAEWIAKHIGDPKDWKIEGERLLDTFRAPGYQLVGIIKPHPNGIEITWVASGRKSELPAWDEFSETEGG